MAPVNIQYFAFEGTRENIYYAKITTEGGYNTIAHNVRFQFFNKRSKIFRMARSLAKHCKGQEVRTENGYCTNASNIRPLEPEEEKIFLQGLGLQ